MPKLDLKKIKKSPKKEKIVSIVKNSPAVLKNENS